MPFRFAPLELPGPLLIEPPVYRDARGSFMETFKESEFRAAGIRDVFRQDSRARSNVRGAVRGMHYQLPPAAQAKLVQATRGSIHDVVVDIRKGSPTYGRHVAVELSEENARILYVPVGFAHGYCTLTDDTEVEYKLSSEYAPAAERAFRWDDPALDIRWPVEKPVISEKDARAPRFADADIAFAWTG